MRLLRDGVSLMLGLDIATAPGAGRLPAELVIRAPGAELTLAALLRPSRGKASLEASATATGLARLQPGSYAVTARLDGPDGPELTIGTAQVSTNGRIGIVGPTRIGVAAQHREAASWAASRVAQSVVLTAGRVRMKLERVARSRARRLPEPFQRRLRALYSATGRT